MKIFKNLIYFSICLIILIQIPVTNATPKVSNTPYGVKSGASLSDDALRSILYPYITDTLRKYYGGNGRQFDLHDAKLSIAQPDPELFTFIITVQVVTFTGPHNPPYGIETVTIETSPYGTKIIDFKHEDEKLPTH
jgi:Predicted N6-adenine-specific DNA methylase